MHGRRRFHPARFLVLAIIAAVVPGFTQTRDERQRTAASLDGTTGLFKLWDAETLRQGELNLSFGFSHYNRDPGELSFKTFPAAGAIGITDRFEFFTAVDVHKRVNARSALQTTFQNGFPPPAAVGAGTTAKTLFNNEAPFIGVGHGDGTGDIRMGIKFNVLSERRGSPFSLALVTDWKMSTHFGGTDLHKGLGTGEANVGGGFLASKTVGRARLHFNNLINHVGDPTFGGGHLDLQNEWVYRAGGGFPTVGPWQIISEIEGTTYFGSRSFGANPRSPLDLIVGLRLYPSDVVSLGLGYRASLNHVDENVNTRVFPTRYSGMVAQVTYGRRMNHPPTVSCAAPNTTIKQDEQATVRASGSDPDHDSLTYSWTASGGKVTGSGDTATFDATGLAPGRYTVTATVSDGHHTATCSTEITVIKKNQAPTVTCAPSSTTITVGDSTAIRANASDPNNDRLAYAWTINGEKVASDGPELTFGSSGREPGTYTVAVTVSDGELTATCSSSVTVQPRPNQPPTIECLTSNVDVASGGTVQLQARASDPDGDSTSITWSATGGSVSGSGSSATFNASGVGAGTYTVTATVEDGRGGRASCTLTVNVSERILLTRQGKKGVCGDFATGMARVDNCAKGALDDLAVRMQNDPRLRANIIGYTDARERKGLGAKRAKAVADYLTKKGLDASRLTTTDGGSANPLGDNKTVAGRKQNRRVEIELTSR